ncbi:hypothetical protein [Chryseobacterium daeguense]|uniref:hypothetical protein n=1 Tax=Chryseobacterium daeguense TaxID=412438 RepID=UPI0004224E3E|nr:hypothetical protein [Chryseobacterium daeguense]
MKKIFVLFTIICINALSAQKIGMRTSNPQGPFHLDTRANNPATGGLPPLATVYDDFLIDENGNMNIGPYFYTNLPTRSRLHLFFSTTGGDNVRIDGLLPAPNPESIDLLGVIRPNQGISYIKREMSINEMSIPKSTLFVLNADINNFLDGVSAGGAQEMPLTLVKNAIDGLTYNPATHFVTLPAGTYQFTLIYAASHSGCTLSSYFYDFPFETSFARVHSTADHLTGTGAGSRHSGKITYTSKVNAGKMILLNLGRGVSGNCSGNGMTLSSDGTQFLIKRIGN